MSLHSTRTSFSRSLNSHQHQFVTRPQPRDIVVDQPKQQQQQQQEQQWQETVDHRKLVLGEVIDRGSFSVVYKGTYEGRTVAVKVLDLGEKRLITEDIEEAVKSIFLREVGVWQNLDHPNVTKMIGATKSIMSTSRDKNNEPSTENNFAIVSEYINGGSLRSYILKNQHQKLPMRIIYQFALDIAKGLSYLHSKNIVHLDVKPDNILMDNQFKMKLADFGGSVFKPPRYSLMSDETGTRGYMAPEIVSRKPYGFKSDVYSFGICLWEIYSCDIAYKCDLSNYSPIAYENTRPRIPADCPRPLARLIQRCWDTDPRKRPEMKEVVVKLEELRCQATSH